MRINSFTLGGFTATANQHVGGSGNNIKVFTGLESPERRLSRFNLSNADGAYVVNSLYGGRMLLISVEILGSTISDFSDRVFALESALRYGDRQPKTMTIVDSSGNSYEVDGFCASQSDGAGFGQRKQGTYTFEFFVPNSFIKSATVKSSRVYLQDTSGGLTIPTPVPASFGDSGGGSVSIVNAGNEVAYPTITVFGSLTANVTITNETNGQVLQYQNDIDSGGYIVINTNIGMKTVKNQDDDNRIQFISPSKRDFIRLEPGVNVITFTHQGAYNSTANALFQWQDSYIGL